jgi:hypothetical protein
VLDFFPLLIHMLETCFTALVLSLAASELSVLSLTPSSDSASATSRQQPSAVEISGREAITITFDRSVIALGADFAPGALPLSLTPFVLSPAVAGTFHWVTTSVARFDTDGPWPPELAITLSLNPALRSFDGRAPVADGRVWNFETPSLSMYAGRVTSNLALNLTGGRWDAAAQPLAPGALEFPPDATLELRFDFAVSVAMLQTALALRPARAQAPLAASNPAGDAPPRAALPGLRISACRDGSAQCVLVHLDGPLQAGALYSLELPPRSRFHEAAGRTRRALAVSLSGLCPFALPFRREPSSSAAAGMAAVRALRASRVAPAPTPVDLANVRYRRLHLWLRHGLGRSITAAELLGQLRLTSESPGTGGGAGALIGLSGRLLSPSVLLLEAALQPNTSYALRVAASTRVVDGFGLPLQAASFTFQTVGPLSPLFLFPGGALTGAREVPTLRIGAHNATALAALEVAWPALLRGDTLCTAWERSRRVPRCWARAGEIAQSLSLRPVADAIQVPAAIASLHNREQLQIPSSMPVVTIDAANVGVSEPILRTLRLPVASSSRLFLQTAQGAREYRSAGLQSALLSSGHLAATTSTLPVSANRPAALLVWVINATSGRPVPHASLTLFASDCSQGPQRAQPCYIAMTAADVRTVARATTDADGIATIAADQLTEPVGRGASFHLLVASTLPSAHGGAQNGAHDGGSELLVLPDISFDHTSLALPHGGIVASLLIDRAVYKPNDTVRAAAWIWVSLKNLCAFCAFSVPLMTCECLSLAPSSGSLQGLRPVGRWARQAACAQRGPRRRVCTPELQASGPLDGWSEFHALRPAARDARRVVR